MSARAALTALCLSLAIPAGAADASHTTASELACGHARLRAKTTSIAHVPPSDELVWTAQEITLRNGDGSSRPLRLLGVNDKPGSTDLGLPAIVSSWQCLNGSDAPVIELWLTCNRADLGGICGGQREWERLVDVTGKPLDTGYAPQDPRYEALSKRLGIPEEGVRLQDALGN